jgi:hypothetical protein
VRDQVGTFGINKIGILFFDGIFAKDNQYPILWQDQHPNINTLSVENSIHLWKNQMGNDSSNEFSLYWKFHPCLHGDKSLVNQNAIPCILSFFPLQYTEENTDL